MTERDCDVLVVGAGPGGLAAAKAARDCGANEVVVLERNSYAGGILKQCIHDGFGLIRYGKALTGPEYAHIVYREALESGAEVLFDRHVTNITPDREVTAYTRDGIERYKARSIVLATGCRERTRGAITVPGSRPAGVFTAGVAQRLINCQNVMVGKRVVILGSGDIGLIMARRLTLEGARVIAVAEIMPEPCGLARNVSQCLYDFSIPLYVNTTVTEIIGKKRVEAVKLAEVDKNRKPIMRTERLVECDTLILSVGLIPENEVAQTAGIGLNDDNCVITDKFLQTSIKGIFSCGNSRRVCDLADYVSQQGELAGKNAVSFICESSMLEWDDTLSNCMKKGFPDENSTTCILCPNGCQIRWNSNTDTFEGNKCSKGIGYARQEKDDPVRTVTTTVKVMDGSQRLIPVRSVAPVGRDDQAAAVRSLSGIHVKDMNSGYSFRISIENEKSIDMVVC